MPPPSSTHFDTGGGMTVLAVLGAAGGAPGASCHLFPALLSATQKLVDLAVKQPELRLLQLLLGSHALTTAAAIVSTSYWATPQVGALLLLHCINITAGIAKIEGSRLVLHADACSLANAPRWVLQLITYIVCVSPAGGRCGVTARQRLPHRRGSW